jgi:hypothetical protein
MTVVFSILLLVSSGCCLIAANSRWLATMDEDKRTERRRP